jgi:hypothetical protein
VPHSIQGQSHAIRSNSIKDDGSDVGEWVGAERPSCGRYVGRGSADARPAARGRGSARPREGSVAAWPSGGPRNAFEPACVCMPPLAKTQLPHSPLAD